MIRAFVGLAALLSVACAAPASGPWKPQKPVEFVVASGPGGGSDQLARFLQSIIQKHQLISSPVIVTNKGGGSGSEAFVYGKGAAGDAHKVIFATNNVWLLPLGTAVGYSPADLRPVASVALDEFLLWVNAASPYADVKAFLAAARSGQPRLTMAGTQSKDTDQVLVRQIEKRAGVLFTYVPFKSGSEVAVQLAGGHVAANTNNPQENVAQWRAGKIRPLCVFAPERLTFRTEVAHGQSWADIPTCAESGLPIDRYQMPRTVWLPNGTTDEQVTFYLDVLRKVRETAEWKQWLERGSQTDTFLSGLEFERFIKTDEAWLRTQFAEDGWLIQ